MFRTFAVVMVLLCSVNFAIAQPGRGFGGKMTVTGYILDSKTGEALIGATVQATSSDGGTGSFGITDENGKFSFEIPRPGKYTLQFNYVSYKELVKDVNIMPGLIYIGKASDAESYDERTFVDKTTPVDSFKSVEDAFEKSLKHFLQEELFSRNVPFERTNDSDSCKNCDYRLLCGKLKSKF